MPTNKSPIASLEWADVQNVVAWNDSGQFLVCPSGWPWPILILDPAIVYALAQAMRGLVADKADRQSSAVAAINVLLLR